MRLRGAPAMAAGLFVSAGTSAVAFDQPILIVLDHRPGSGPDMIAKVVVYSDGQALVRGPEGAYSVFPLTEAERSKVVEQARPLLCAECGPTVSHKQIDLWIDKGAPAKTYLFLFGERGSFSGGNYVLHDAELEDKGSALYARTAELLGERVASRLRFLGTLAPGQLKSAWQPEEAEVVIWTSKGARADKGTCDWPPEWPWLDAFLFLSSAAVDTS